jgi:hypothetical protein
MTQAETQPAENLRIVIHSCRLDITMDVESVEDLALITRILDVTKKRMLQRLEANMIDVLATGKPGF